jgi:exodeoxyribonuclease V
MTTDKKLTVDDLSPDQRKVYDVMFDWSESRWSNLLTTGGFAGTGKSTLLGVFSKSLQDRNIGPVAYCCYTGRASSVLARKLKAARVSTTNKTLRSGKALRGRFASLFYSASSPEADMPYCGTIHRLLYRPVIDDKTEELKGWVKRDALDRPYKLIIVDEASMISDDLLRDLQFHGAPILAVGDHGQLPPVMASGDLMQKPMLRLEKIHRQAEGSPIIRLAHHVREGGSISNWKMRGQEAVTFHPKSETNGVLASAYLKANLLDVVTLCWMNKTRCRLNESVRKALGHDGEDVILNTGEVAICLKNKPPVYNGMRGLALGDAEPDSKEPWRAHVAFDFPEEGVLGQKFEICIPQLGREKTYASVDDLGKDDIDVERMSDGGSLFDFGYACTVHKFQGGQADHVVFYVDRAEDGNDETRRLFYTAITRSSQKLDILL